MSNAEVIAGLFIGIAIGCIYALLMLAMVENELYGNLASDDRPKVFKVTNYVTIGSILVMTFVGLIIAYFAQKKPAEQVN